MIDVGTDGGAIRDTSDREEPDLRDGDSFETVFRLTNRSDEPVFLSTRVYCRTEPTPVEFEWLSIRTNRTPARSYDIAATCRPLSSDASGDLCTCREVREEGCTSNCPPSGRACRPGATLARNRLDVGETRSWRWSGLDYGLAGVDNTLCLSGEPLEIRRLVATFCWEVPRSDTDWDTECENIPFMYGEDALIQHDIR